MSAHAYIQLHVNASLSWPTGGVDFIGSHVIGQFEARSPDLDKCFNVNVLSDTLVEGVESFTVSLHLLTNLPPSLADRIIINEHQMKVSIIDTSTLKKVIVTIHVRCTCTCMCMIYHHQCLCSAMYMLLQGLAYYRWGMNSST